MKVMIDGGETIDLGTTGATPTIGITDYSRRVADDFGVTTVVPRGFSRRLSVRLAVAFDQVDAIQRRLADLRATAATWVADDRFEWLSARGYYKDFDLDLATPPVSFCTLTVEGLAETETVADAGGDPAPEGRSSTLRLIQPVTVTDTELTSSSVAESDAPAWAAGTSYATGARVVRGHRVWESVVDANIGHDPATGSAGWLDVGPTNRWAMFDQALGTATAQASGIAVTIDAGSADALALLDVTGASVRVQAAGYDQSAPVSAGAITFFGLPGGQVTVTVAGAASVGTLIVGRLVPLGLTEASPGAGITDYSRKEVDDFGEVTIVQRAWAKRMTAKALIRTDAIDVVANRIASVRAQPSLWIGDAGLDSLTVYGFFKDFSIEVGDSVSKLALSIEGLSKAAPVVPLATSVDWPNVGDPDGTKPTNNADKTSENTSKDTAAVGGRPVGDVLADIAAAKARQNELDTVTIPAINQAAAQAADRIAAARARADQAITDLSSEAHRLDSRIDAVGSYDDGPVRAEIHRVDQAAIDRDVAVAQSQVVLEARLTDTIVARAQDVTTAFTDADRGLASRADALEATARTLSDTTIPAVSARVKATEDALVDLPNRYAAASRTDTLEAQLRRDIGSNLNDAVNYVNGRVDESATQLSARIEERATAIADSKAGAVAQTVQTLRTEYNQTYGQVQQQAGAISGIDGRTTVYWEVTGTTPDGEAIVRLSKSDGSRGVFYIGADLFVAGDAIIDGAIKTRHLSIASVGTLQIAENSATVSAAVQNYTYYYPSETEGGVEIASAELHLPFGGSVLIFGSYITSGDSETTLEMVEIGGQSRFYTIARKITYDASGTLVEVTGTGAIPSGNWRAVLNWRSNGYFAYSAKLFALATFR